MGSRRLRTVWIGTYPAGGQGAAPGAGEGIWRVTLDTVSGSLDDVSQVAVTPAPSFLAARADGRLLYAVNEDRPGRLTVLASREDGLEEVGTAGTAGEHPCHLLLDDQRRVVVVANYGTGSVAVFRLGSDGLPPGSSPDQVVELSGCGPDPKRQLSSHAHFALPTPSGRHILVVDLGGDTIHRFTPDPATGRLTEQRDGVVLPPATGPRHAVFSADGRRLCVVGELDGRLHTVDWDGRRDEGHLRESVRLHPAASGNPQPAHISRDGEELTITCRGSERVVIHRVGNAAPRLVREFGLPGRWPRHHATIDGWLVVAQQHGGGVVSLDAHGQVRGEAAIPAPACVLPGPMLEGEPG